MMNISTGFGNNKVKHKFELVFICTTNWGVIV